MFRSLFFACIFFMSADVLADSIMCDGAKVEIAFNKSLQSKFEDIVLSTLTVSKGGVTATLPYDGDIDFIGAECRKNKTGKSFIVFQAFCGGSGCNDGSNIGIIDPKDVRVLLVPRDGSHIVATQIFGSEVAPIEKPLSVEDSYEKLFSK